MTKRMTHSPLGFRIIGGFKVVGASVLFAAAIGVFRLMNKDVAEVLEHVAATWRLDPHNRYIDSVISWAGKIDRARLREIGLGTFFYASLHLTEGLGLIFECRWAGYLTVIATGSLIPVELWEIFRKPNVTKIVVLVVNVAVVIYLAWKLIEERRENEREDHASPS